MSDRVSGTAGTRDGRWRPAPAHVVVLRLPGGGVPVAHEIADALGAPLDVFVVRKLGVPGREELAMGAIASDVLAWSTTTWCAA